MYKIFFSATKVYMDNVLTCRAWKRDSVRRNGTFVAATRAWVELVHAHGVRTVIWAGQLDACTYCMATPYLAWQPSATQL